MTSLANMLKFRGLFSLKPQRWLISCSLLKFTTIQIIILGFQTGQFFASWPPISTFPPSAFPNSLSIQIITQLHYHYFPMGFLANSTGTTDNHCSYVDPSKYSYHYNSTISPHHPGNRPLNHPDNLLFLGGLSSLESVLSPSLALLYSSHIRSTSAIRSSRCIGTRVTTSPSGTDCDVTARGDRGAGEWLRARYSTVGLRWARVQGRFGGLFTQWSRSTILRFRVKDGGPGETHLGGVVLVCRA